MTWKQVGWIATALVLTAQPGTLVWQQDLLIMMVAAFLGWTWSDVW